MPSIVAVVSVAVIVLAMVAFFAGGSGEDPAPEQQAQNAPRTPEATPRAQAEPTTGEKADRPASAADRKAKERAADRRKDRRNRPRTEPRDAPDPEGAPDVYVEVYNNTTITGLAASTAAELQDGGWQVVGVDNWRGDIPSSTVYYPAGMADEAHQLADTLGYERVRAAVAPMKFDRLTVILTPDAA